MNTFVTLCGRLAEAGGGELGVELPEGGCSVAALRALVAAGRPELAAELGRPGVRLCLDDTIVGEDAWVAPGRRVALFPPLSGG